MNAKNGFIGILVANRTQRKYVLEQYLQFDSTKMKIICFTPSSINWKQRSVIGLHRAKQKWAVGRFPFPQVVYNRCYGNEHDLIEQIGAAIGNDKCFNHINQLNKLDIYNSLNCWLGDYFPETVTYSEENAIPMLEKHELIFLKPFYGHQGKGVYRAELKNTGEIHIGHHYFTPKTIVKDEAQFRENLHLLLGATPYIIQKGIAIRQINNQVFDIRALVQKNEKGLWSVTNLVSRIAYKGSYNTSIYKNACLSQEVLNRLYPPSKVKTIMTSIYDISLRTAEIIDTSTSYHLGEFSVDFALDIDAHPWIIELNGKPQKDLYNGIRKQNIVYKRPIQYAQYLCHH